MIALKFLTRLGLALLGVATFAGITALIYATISYSMRFLWSAVEEIWTDHAKWIAGHASWRKPYKVFTLGVSLLIAMALVVFVYIYLILPGMVTADNVIQ